MPSPGAKRVCLFERDWGQCSHHDHDTMANIYRDTRKNTLQISSSSRTKNGVPKFQAISGYFIEKSIIIWMTIHKKFVQGCSGRVLINKPYFSVVLSSPTQTPLVNSWPLSCQQLSIELQRGIKKRPVTVGFHFLVFLPFCHSSSRTGSHFFLKTVLYANHGGSWRYWN